MSRVFRAFDSITRYVDGHREADFDSLRQWIDSQSPRSLTSWDDNAFLGQLACKVAYQATRADRLEGFFESDGWLGAFRGFDLRQVARLDPDRVLDQYWEVLKPIRFKKKVASIIWSARAIRQIGKEFGDFGAYLAQFSIPPRIESEEDVTVFWSSIASLRTDMERREMPNLGNWPTLLHFLMEDMRYDCIKPDVVAMRVGYVVGAIPKPYGAGNQRALVERVQRYGLKSGIRPPLMDAYLLTFGGQSSTVGYVRSGFSSCRSTEKCTNRACPLRRSRLCAVIRPSHGGLQ
ncbi:MAG: DNA-3-methyladenine glycosylase I [Phycisphaerae bacterium]|nr:DNA-3-methyladenine glycosylase I [Phycisphaerae bacterium]